MRSKFGNPWEEGVQLTPLPEPNKPAYIQELIEDAKSKGAKILNSKGGQLSPRIIAIQLYYILLLKTWKCIKKNNLDLLSPSLLLQMFSKCLDDMAESNYGQQVSVFGENADTLAPLFDVLVNLVCRVNLNSSCQRGPRRISVYRKKGLRI